MQAIQLTKYGEPDEGLRLVEIAEPCYPKPGQILISVEYAPINDSDLLVASGLYAVQPKLPSARHSLPIDSTLRNQPVQLGRLTPMPLGQEHKSTQRLRNGWR